MLLAPVWLEAKAVLVLVGTSEPWCSGMSLLVWSVKTIVSLWSGVMPLLEGHEMSVPLRPGAMYVLVQQEMMSVLVWPWVISSLVRHETARPGVIYVLVWHDMVTVSVWPEVISMVGHKM